MDFSAVIFICDTLCLLQLKSRTKNQRTRLTDTYLAGLSPVFSLQWFVLFALDSSKTNTLWKSYTLNPNNPLGWAGLLASYGARFCHLIMSTWWYLRHHLKPKTICTGLDSMWLDIKESYIPPEQTKIPVAFHTTLVSVFMNLIWAPHVLGYQLHIRQLPVVSSKSSCNSWHAPTYLPLLPWTDKARLQHETMAWKTLMRHLLFPLLLIPDSRCNLDMDSFQAQHFSSRNKAPGAPMNPCQSMKLFHCMQCHLQLSPRH